MKAKIKCERSSSMIKTVIVACLVSFASVPGFAQTDAATVVDAGKLLVELVPRTGMAFMDSHAGIGLSIGVFDNGRTHFYHFGSTRTDQSQVPSKDTVYEIGSITKSITGILLARAAIDGKVKLDDDVRKYLEGEYPNLTFEGEPIRLMHLANSTSSLPDNLPDISDALSKISPDELPFALVRILEPYTKRNFLDDLHKVTLKAKPGVDSAHSNAAPQLLSYVLERVYGAPFEELVARFVERPLGLKSGTAAVLTMAKGHNGKGIEMPLLTMKTAEAAGGLRFSVADMTKYIAFQLDERDETVALSHKATWQTLDRQHSVGLYWNISKTDRGRRLSSSGGTFGFSSFCDIYPDQKLGIVLLANKSDETAQDGLRKASESIVEAIRKTTLPR